MDSAEPDTVRARAHLPGLDIDITHHRAADAEQLSIHLTAVPSFEDFGRMLEVTNPFAFWAQGAQLAWSFWLEILRPLPLASPSQPSRKAVSHSAQAGRAPD